MTSSLDWPAKSGNFQSPRRTVATLFQERDEESASLIVHRESRSHFYRDLGRRNDLFDARRRGHALSQLQRRAASLQNPRTEGSLFALDAKPGRRPSSRSFQRKSLPFKLPQNSRRASDFANAGILDDEPPASFYFAIEPPRP